MNIRFIEIDIQGFMSIGHSTVSLTDRGLTLVQGFNHFKDDNARSNGSGKSSIFEAIYWTLTGSTIRGTKDVVNKNYSSGCSCSLTLEYNGDKFVIVRSRGHEIHGTSLRLWINDEDKSGKGIKETENLISTSLDMVDSTVISSVVILGQGLPSKFTSYGASSRKQLLESMSKLSDTLDVLNTKLSIRNSQLSDQLRGLQDKINQHQSSIRTYQSMISSKTERMEKCSGRSVEEVQAIIDKATQDLRDAESGKESVTTAINANTEEQKKYSMNRQSYALEMRSAMATIQSVNGTIANLKNSRSCPTCGKPFDTETIKSNQVKIHELEIQLVELNKTISSLKEKDAEAMTYVDYYGVIISQLQKSSNEYLKTINDLRSVIFENTTILNLLKQDQSDISDMTSKISELEDEISRLRVEVGEVESRQKNVSAISRFASRDFRGYMIDGVIEFINDRLKVYSSKLFTDNSIAFYLDGNNINIEVNGKSYEGLSGGERQKVDIAIQFSLRDMIMKLSGFNCNILVMDEVFDNLDQAGCQQLLDVIQSSYSDIESVYIITHHSDIPIPYDSKLVVDKDTNNLSSVREE